MPSAPIPRNEPERLAALHRYKILDTPAEADFDDFTQLAAYVCGTPVALISLIDANRQWFKSRVGLNVGEGPRQHAFCAHAIQGRELFVVPDALEDERFRDNPGVTGAPFVRFYAGVPLSTPDGLPLGTLCVLDHVPRTLTAPQRDMLSRLGRQVEGLLKARLARLHREQEFLYHEAILRSAGSAIISVNEQGIIKHFNPEAERMLGYRAEEVIDRLSAGAIHDDAEVAVRAAELSRELGRVIEPGFEVFVARPRSGETETREWTYVRKDGSRFPVLLSVAALRSATGELVGFLGIARDITARKAAAEALRHSEAYLRSILQSEPDCLKVLSLEGRLLDMAEPGQRLFGVRDFETIQNADWSRFWPRDEDRAAVQRAVAEARAGETSRFSGFAPTMDGSPKWWDVIVSPIMGQSGRPESLLAVLRDVTLQRDGEEKLRDLNATLEQRVTERTAALQAEREFTEGQNEVLKRVAARQPMAVTLKALALLVENRAAGLTASILVLDEAHGCLRLGAAPSLPAAYNAAVDGLKVGPQAGSCGTAVARREPVVVEDISTDPLWDDYRALALPLGLRACWSVPIFDDAKRVLGTFALYYSRPVPPQPEHLRLIENAAQIASIIISRDREDAARRDIEERLRFMAEHSPDVLWVLTLQPKRLLYVSPAAERIWGLPLQRFYDDFGTWLDGIHPDDRPRVAQARADCAAGRSAMLQQEYRVVQPDGRIRWVADYGQAICDAAGTPERMSGVTRDITERRLAAATLEESERRYRTLFESNPHPMWVYDLATLSFLAVNDAAVHQYGYSRAEFMGLTIADIRPPEDVPRLLENVRSVQDGIQVTTGWRHLRKDGTLIDVEIASHPLVFDGRRAELVLAHDVTARNQAEKAMRESEERLRLALDAAQMGTFDWIPATNHITWTPRHEVLWGFRAGEFDGTYEAFASRLHPEDRAGVGAELARCIAAREPFAAEFRVVWPDASVHWIRSQGEFTFDAAGQPLRMLGLVTEITDLKRAEAALRETEALYRTVFEQAPAGVVLIDPATQRFVQFNDLAAKQLGYNREDFARLTFADIEGSEPPADTRQRIEKILRTGGDDFEAIHRMRRGERRNVLVSARTVESGGRKLCYCVFRDITERLAQEKIERRGQRLEAIGTLAGGVAHDLNNALAPILMSVNLLKALYPRETEILDTMETSVRRAAGMVRQLLTFAKGSEGARVAINVRTLIKEICDILGPTFPKNIRLDSRCPPDLPAIMGDATQLHQVLLNLCVNARDAMLHGGKLVIEAALRDVDDLFAAATPDAVPGRYVVLRVQDSGTGMSPDIIERIFDPFFTTKAPDKGTGLGLSTALGIVKGHGGFLRVQSQPGQGSTFEVHLPAGDTHAGSAHPFGPPSDFRGKGELILVVDDEPTIRETQKLVLQRLNFAPLLATDGADGLIQAAVHLGKLHAVILDMHMPTMNGIDFARAIRRLSPEVPIIASSGRFDPDLEARLRQLNVTVLLPKPFTETELAEALRTLLGDR